MTVIAEKPSLDEVLEHHGVRGMRWGHRKSQGQSSEKSSRNKKIVAGVVISAGAIAGALVLKKYGSQIHASNIAKAKSVHEDAQYARAHMKVAQRFAGQVTSKEPLRIAPTEKGVQAYVKAQKMAALRGQAWVASADGSRWTKTPLNEIFSPVMIRSLYPELD